MMIGKIYSVANTLRKAYLLLQEKMPAEEFRSFNKYIRKNDFEHAWNSLAGVGVEHGGDEFWTLMGYAAEIMSDGAKQLIARAHVQVEGAEDEQSGS